MPSQLPNRVGQASLAGRGVPIDLVLLRLLWNGCASTEPPSSLPLREAEPLAVRAEARAARIEGEERLSAPPGRAARLARDVADEQIPGRFDELTWTAAPGALSAASFERTEVYRVGPVFAKSVADELGMERTAVQHVIGGLVEKGAVARVRGGYVVASVILESDDPPCVVHSNRPIPLSLPLHSTHSQSEQSEPSEVSEGRHAREAVPRAQDLFVDCDAYRDHQTRHFYTRAG